jgi:anaerobic selenocysteine-containing dehydrogenase
MHAASCLPVVTGAWRHEGGGALYNMGELYRWDKTLLQGLDVLDPSTRWLDQSQIGPVLVGERNALQGGPPVSALFVQSTNPRSIAPELGKVHAGFAREDLFVCVHEQFMTETAHWADIVLPATMFLEHDDIYQASAHSRIQIARKLFEPYALSRSNHWVVCELARRLGAEHPGFAMSEWEIIEDLLARSGWPDAEAIWQAGGWDALPDFETAHHLKGFPTPDGRFRFKPDWGSMGPQGHLMPKLPDHLATIDEITPDKPFRLVAAPSRSFLNSTFTETPSSVRREKRPTALLHPKTMRQLDLADGDRVRLGNERGSVVLYAAARDGQHPGTIVVEGIWPNRHFEEGVGVNLLIGADPAPPNGGAAIHDTAVWLEPLVEAKVAQAQPDAVPAE